MKKVLISLGLAMVLVMAMAVPVMAAESGQQSASVTVTAYISFTVADYGATGVAFGSGSPGDLRPDSDQGAEQGAAGLTLEVESNQACDFETMGDDFVYELYSGAATGGSATTLVDSGVDFTTAPVVVVGDIVYNGTDDSYGVVTAVAATTLTVTELSDSGDFAVSDTHTVQRSIQMRSGTATGGSATTLVDSGVDFTTAPAVAVGDIVTNNVDGTTAVVTEVTNTTTLTWTEGLCDFSTGTPAYTVRRVSDIAIANAQWNTTNTSGVNNMSDTYTDVVTGQVPGASQDVWHWLDIPNSPAPRAETYTGTFYYQATAA